MPRRKPAEEEEPDFEVELAEEAEVEGRASGVPAAIEVRCKGCGEETMHKVLSGRLGTRKGFTLEATVKCTECDTVHRVVVKEAGDVTIPAIVSRGGESRKSSVEFPADEVVAVGDELIVDARACVVTGIELASGKRVESATASQAKTVWLKDFEQVKLRFGVNLDDKTISKEMEVDPSRVVEVGEEFILGRLRVTVHSIATGQRTLRRGSAEARDIRRIFARPTKLPESEKARKERNYKRAKALGIPLKPRDEEDVVEEGRPRPMRAPRPEREGRGDRSRRGERR